MLFLDNLQVNYHNTLNQIQFKNFRAIDSDIFMSLVMKLENKGDEIINISFGEIRNIINDKSKSKKEFIDNLKVFQDKLLSLKINLEVICNNDPALDQDDDYDEIYVSFVLFNVILIKPREELLTIRVNDTFLYVFNELKKNFTQLDFKNFIELKSNYSKNLYRILRQYKNTGVYFADIRELRKTLDIPDAYENKYIERDIIKIAVQELKKIVPGLTYEKVYGKGKGKPLMAFKFTFRKDKEVINDKSSKSDKINTVRSKNKFNQFEQCNYDFEDIEKHILSN